MIHMHPIIWHPIPPRPIFWPGFWLYCNSYWYDYHVTDVVVVNRYVKDTYNVDMVSYIVLHPYGLRPMVVFFIVLNILWLGVWQWFAHRLVGLCLWDVLRDTVPFLTFTVAVMAATWWLTQGIQNLWLLLLSKIAIAAALYIGLLWLSGAKILKESAAYLFHN